MHALMNHCDALLAILTLRSERYDERAFPQEQLWQAMLIAGEGPIVAGESNVRGCGG
ncbi:hypothetical protein YERSI8AC_240062 [Enterobacterales bacterium 8AC]|nr:hypothetical protein YERSI8AC_240062 [Enterobacterales bacterium 8AC]